MVTIYFDKKNRKYSITAGLCSKCLRDIKVNGMARVAGTMFKTSKVVIVTTLYCDKCLERYDWSNGLNEMYVHNLKIWVVPTITDDMKAVVDWDPELRYSNPNQCD